MRNILIFIFTVSATWVARSVGRWLVLVTVLAFGVPGAPGADAADLGSRDYWRLPLAPQGDAPDQWSQTERSLAPRACGECHPEQYAQWRTSRHARAFSPGLVGQLLTYDAEQVGGCMQCHAPLAEQRRAFEAARRRGRGHLRSAQGLAAAGNACAGCHLRRYRRHGPPRRGTGATGPGVAQAPHGGVYRSRYFESSDFCSACHQFPQNWAVNGKPLQNTFVEWKASPQAARALTCQSCHMPDRKHLWRGIHDPRFVAAGVTPRFRVDREAARFALTNSGVGHAFPTYVTPKVVMRAVALDEAGRPRAETAVARVIQRVVSYVDGRWVERSDSRLAPGRTATLVLPWGRHDRVRMWLEVHPDDYYDHQVYDDLLRRLPGDGAAARLIAEADSRARASRYRLFETELRRPR